MSRISSREETVFTDALALPDGQRAAFLDRACGDDPGLRARVESLLVAHATTDHLIGWAAEPSTALPEDAAGDRIGRYKLLQKIGEGGCGAVWMAEQEEPVRRRVALKVIKLGMDTREVIARFSVERQALALMDHPNIAKVLDGGATPSGRPFFAMELVRGVPITRFCDDHRLSVIDRLRLFLEVCHGVQHAHQKGIIHRDLKPSNVLVALRDDVPVPIVIDFGIAKATQGRLTEHTLFTAVDQFIGTPVYMSPEQADLNALDVDTRSDIYSLGVVLYELLTGRPPFAAETLAAARLDEVRRMIRETEPPRPSARVRALPEEDLHHAATLRRLAPAQFAPLLRGDLDWIVMKALEKNRARRYETCAAFAADLTRHLKHEPVLARPPSARYRLGRTFRRHRLGFIAAAAVACALVLGTIVSRRQAVRATKAEHAAQEERGRADSLLEFMLSDLREPLGKIGQLSVLDKVATQALEYFESLNPGDIDDRLLAKHASALKQIGEVRLSQERFAEADHAFRAAYSRASALVRRNPLDADMLFERGRTELLIAIVYRRRRDFAPAAEWMERHRQSAVALAALEPGSARSTRAVLIAQQNVAALAQDLGRSNEAQAGFLALLPLVDAALEAQPGDTDLKGQRAEIVSFLGTSAERLGDLRTAERRHGELVASFETMPAEDRWQLKLADALSVHARVLAVTGSPQLAQEKMERARELAERLARKDPQNHTWLLALATTHLHQAALAKAMQPADTSLELIVETRKKFEALAAREPTDVRLTGRLAIAWRVEAEILHAAHDPTALAAASRAVELGRKLIAERRVLDGDLAEYVLSCAAAGRIAAAQGLAPTAIQTWQAAHDALAPRLVDSKSWRLLEAGARLASLLGLADEARDLVSRLERMGYVALEPWPEVNPSQIPPPR